MRFKLTVSGIMVLFITAMVFSEEPAGNNRIISFNDYIAAIEKTLPELKSNEMDVLSADNKVKNAKSGSDTAF